MIIKHKILNILSKTYVIFALVALMVFSFGFNTNQAFSADGAETSSGTFVPLENPTTITSFEGLINAILKVVAIIAIPVVTLLIIYSGFLFVSARGDPGKLKTAKSTLLYTIIGAAVIFGAWMLSNALVGTVQTIESGVK